MSSILLHPIVHAVSYLVLLSVRLQRQQALARRTNRILLAAFLSRKNCLTGSTDDLDSRQKWLATSSASYPLWSSSSFFLWFATPRHQRSTSARFPNVGKRRCTALSYVDSLQFLALCDINLLWMQMRAVAKSDVLPSFNVFDTSSSKDVVGGVGNTP